MRRLLMIAVISAAACAVLALMGCPPISSPIEQDVAKKTNADLSALTLSSGTLSPAFAAGTTAYTATVGSGVTSITITATKAATGAKIEAQVNGGSWADTASGAPSPALSLNVGTNTIEVRVTAEDGKSTKTYTISVYRLSAAALLSALSTTAGTLSPAFDANTVSYTVSVANTVSAITVTATVAHAGAAIQVQVNGGGWQTAPSGSASPSLSLNVGDNPVEVKVTAEDGQSANTYTVAVHRISTNADLSALEPSSGTLTPAFSASILGYSLTVGVSSITVRPNAADTRASIRVQVNGEGWQTVVSGSDSTALSLSVGANTVVVEVTAEDWVTKKSYTIATISYPTYTVSYNANNATSCTAPLDSTNYLTGQTVTVLGYGSLSKTGCYFIGWNTAADGSGTKRRVGLTFAMGSANVTLYAQWLGDLVASDGAAGDQFGGSVAVSSDGSTLVIGVDNKTVGGNSYQGEAYVFTKSGSSWSQAQILTASDGTGGDGFGMNVAASSDGSTLVIGAAHKTVGSNSGQGATYVFTKSGSTWSQAQILTGSDGATNDNFGWSVAVSSDGSTLVIGAWSKTVGINSYQGAVYVFTKSGSTWSQAQILTGSDGAAGDVFGSSVAVSSDGSTLVIGAFAKKIGSIQQGAAYVFAKSGGSWSQAQILTASDGAADDRFGMNIAVSSDGSTLVIGVDRKTVGSNNYQGEVYVFTKSGGTWSQAQILTASDGAAGDHFGISMAASSDGSTLAIGAYNKTIGSNSYQGEAYLFTKSGSTWSQVQILTGSDGATNDHFGSSVAVSSDGSTLVIGAYNKTIGSNSSQGAVYVF